MASDLASAKTAHTGFGASLKEVDMRLVSGDAHDYWMGQLQALRTHGEQLASAPDLEEARTRFAFFSQALVNAVDRLWASAKTAGRTLRGALPDGAQTRQWGRGPAVE